MDPRPAPIPEDAAPEIAGIVASLPLTALYQIVREPDGTTYFTYFGEGIRDILGIEPQEIYANPTLPQDLVHPVDIPRFLSMWEISIRDLVPFQVMVRQRHRTKGLRLSLLRSRPQAAGGGRVVWNGIQMDLTDQLPGVEPAPPDTRDLLRVCAWCTRVCGVDGVWYPTRGLLNLFHPHRITHGLCPECAERFAV